MHWESQENGENIGLSEPDASQPKTDDTSVKVNLNRVVKPYSLRICEFINVAQ